MTCLSANEMLIVKLLMLVCVVYGWLMKIYFDRQYARRDFDKPAGLSIESTSEIIEENGTAKTTAPKVVVTVEPGADKKEVLAWLKSIWT